MRRRRPAPRLHAGACGREQSYGSVVNNEIQTARTATTGCRLPFLRPDTLRIDHLNTRPAAVLVLVIDMPQEQPQRALLSSIEAHLVCATRGFVVVVALSSRGKCFAAAAVVVVAVAAAAVVVVAVVLVVGVVALIAGAAIVLAILVLGT